MEKRRNIVMVSVLVVIVIISAFCLEQLSTEPQMPALAAGGQAKLTVNNKSQGIYDPYNHSFFCPGYGYNNVSSTINVTFYSSHATFSVFTDVFVLSFTQDSDASIQLVVKKIDQYLQMPVTNFTFEIKNFTLQLNKSAMYERMVMTNNDIYRTTSHTVVFDLPPAPWPFTFTVGNISNFNAYYYVNYSFEFIPIVEIGFLHFDLKPIQVEKLYIGPWGFKTPQKSIK